MFKIIQLDVSNNCLYTESNSNNHQLYKWYDLKNEPILQSQNFERTLASIGSTNILDLEKRSSWTHKLKFILDIPSDATQFFEQHNILCEKDGIRYDNFTLLKYETGDFFLNHRDTDLTDALDDIVHKYTCLIFCPYRDDNHILKGGELFLRHPDGLYEIKFDPSVETNKNHFVMVIFSIDMYHEVLPVISGSRYVFKKPLFVKTTIKKMEDKNEVDELCDGGDVFGSGGGDY